MKKSRYTPGQIASGLRQVVEGGPVAEACPKMAISEQTLHPWKKRSRGLEAAQGRRLRVLKEENRKLKQLMADPKTYLVQECHE